MRILIVEDDATLRETLQRGLIDAGHAVDTAADGDEAAWALQAARHDIVILDLGLPGRDGLGVLRSARQAGHAAAVLILSARDAVEDRIAGLDAGADDSLVKPFAFEELVARLRSLMRRRHGAPDPVLRAGTLAVDTRRRLASVCDVPIRLTAREYDILEYLLLRRDEVVSRSDMLDHLYAFADDPDSNIVEHFIARIRRKLARVQLDSLIQTRRGEGYVLTTAANADAHSDGV